MHRTKMCSCNKSRSGIARLYTRNIVVCNSFFGKKEVKLGIIKLDVLTEFLLQREIYLDTETNMADSLFVHSAF